MKYIELIKFMELFYFEKAINCGLFEVNSIKFGLDDLKMHCIRTSEKKILVFGDWGAVVVKVVQPWGFSLIFLVMHLALCIKRARMLP